MKRKKILIIDDDEMNLQIAKMILEKKLPCEVICANNGIDGLDILRNQRVSLVLLDILMPLFDGIETLQEIRDNKYMKDIPVMMLTASGDIENIQKVGALGVKDYIKKPFMPADLIARVTRKLAEVHDEDILIIGDNEKVLLEMRNVIEENFPHEALIAPNYDEAVKILNNSQIELIISCAEMNFTFGFRILSFLKTDERLSEIPFMTTTPEKILEIIDKVNPPKVKDPPKVTAPPVREKFWKK